MNISGFFAHQRKRKLILFPLQEKKKDYRSTFEQLLVIAPLLLRADQLYMFKAIMFF